MKTVEEVLRIVLIGCGATLVMDIWLMSIKRMGVQTLNFALIGRWVGHVFRGRIAHAAIGKAPPVAHEALLGWGTHYAVGIAFAFLLVGIAGGAWMAAPSPGIAILTGVATVAFPLFVMQPAMGLGIAASKTAAPVRSVIRSLINHAVFGVGLFLSACVIAWVFR
ncbi:MAG: DUF2938 domain-containing protein [Dechloromonas sp.]|nr:MAG: DUF2938 domain-containing protein [Dechloromonas sp.]